MDVGGSGHYGMDDLGLAVDPDMGLHAEVQLVPFTCLVHVGITLFVLVLRRRRGVDEGGIDHRALAHLDAPGLPEVVDLLEELPAGMMLLEERAELDVGAPRAAGTQGILSRNNPSSAPPVRRPPARRFWIDDSSMSASSCYPASNTPRPATMALEWRVVRPAVTDTPT